MYIIKSNDKNNNNNKHYIHQYLLLTMIVCTLMNIFTDVITLYYVMPVVHSHL